MTTTTRTARFTGKTVLVTGGGAGIGRAIALAFAAEGGRVVVTGRTEGPLKETVHLIEEQGGTALAVTADVRSTEEIEAAVRTAVDRFGSLDVAVNNAGVLYGRGPLADLAEADWQAQLDINVTGVFLSMRAEIAQMRGQETGGAIVNIASAVGAHIRLPGSAAYGATKAAVWALTHGAALDHTRDGVRINAVSPGASDTSMSLLPGEDEAGRTERLRANHPLGRVSSLEEVAAAVLYIASPEAASIVGADLVVDGGGSA